MSNYITEEEAMEFAKQYGLEYEVKYLIDLGWTPYEALAEWDVPDEEFDGQTIRIRGFMKNHNE